MHEIVYSYVSSQSQANHQTTIRTEPLTCSQRNQKRQHLSHAYQLSIAPVKMQCTIHIATSIYTFSQLSPRFGQQLLLLRAALAWRLLPYTGFAVI